MLIFGDPREGKWYFRIVEMENGDFVLQTRLEFTGGINAASRRVPYIWHEHSRGSLEQMQSNRADLDKTYRTEYKTIKRVVED